MSLRLFHRLILNGPGVPHYTFMVGLKQGAEEYYKLRIPGEQRVPAATTRALADSTDGKLAPAVGVGAVVEAS